MAWIKKNLGLVLGGLIGLILLGGSGFFLYSQYGREAAVNTALEEKRGEWNRLIGLNPFPDEKNIKAVKDDTAAVDKLVGDLRARISAINTPPVHDTLSLKLLIETTISDLKKEAEASGVHLPQNYAFTFQRLREMPQFDSNAIPRIAEQVAEVSILCRVLFEAKVHTIDFLKRVPILKDEGSGNDYLTKKSVTNNWVVRSPYDFSFRAFSSELAEVLKGFAALNHCIVIKTINVEPTSLPQEPGPTPGLMPTSITPAGMPGGMPGRGPGGMDPALAARYGLGAGGRPGEGGGSSAGGMSEAMRNRYGLGPGGGAGGGGEAMRARYGGMGGGGGNLPPAQALSAGQPGVAVTPGASQPPSAPSVVLEEKPLRVILQVDFVKPKPVAEAGKRGGSARTAAPAPDAAPADAAAGGETPAAPAE